MQKISTIVVNPDSKQIAWEVADALQLIQNKDQSRQIKTLNFNEVSLKSEGVLTFNGGQPIKGDGSYATGQTSRLGIVWWSDFNRNKHVRIEADRTQASNFSVPDIFPLSVPFYLLVYSQPAFCCYCNYEISILVAHWQEENQFSCDICMDQRAYFAETGFLPSGSRKKKL